MSNIELPSALLIRMVQHRFCNSAKDEQLSQDTRDRHGLGKDAGEWRKTKFLKDFIGPLNSHMNYIRTRHYELTLPFEQGEQILTEPLQDEYDQMVQAGQERLSELIQEAKEGFPAALEKARQQHNGTFNEADYPSADQFGLRWGIDILRRPLPQSVHLGKFEAAYGHQLQTYVEGRLRDANQVLWDRILDPVLKMAEVLASDAPRADSMASIVNNVRRISELAPRLNLNGGSPVGEAVEKIQGLLRGIDLDNLKTQPEVRAAVAKQALATAQSLVSIGGRKFE